MRLICSRFIRCVKIRPFVKHITLIRRYTPIKIRKIKRHPIIKYCKTEVLKRYSEDKFYNTLSFIGVINVFVSGICSFAVFIYFFIIKWFTGM